MGLAYRETRAGLVVAEQAADEASVSRALKEINPSYVLQRHPGEVDGGWVYKVFCVVSEDQEAVCVYTWCDDYGNPLPLSFGLVEDLKKWLPENRGRRGPDADECNRRLEQQLDRDRADDVNALGEEHAAKIERGRITVSLGPRTRKRHWQRNGHRPEFMRH